MGFVLEVEEVAFSFAKEVSGSLSSFEVSSAGAVGLSGVILSVSSFDAILAIVLQRIQNDIEMGLKY
jgi:hypothetical protein